MGDGRIPDAQAVAAAAQVGAHDVEAEKRKARVVIDAGDGGRRLAVDLADEEALRIDGCEAGRVGEARIPALRGRPVGGDGDLLGAHRADAQVALLGHAVRSPARR
jgi:hypothetical protein